MPSFNTTVELTLNGERVRITTRAGDQLNAERGIGQSPLNSPVELGMRVWWSALRRQYPDHPAAKTFREFVDELDGGDELDEMDEDPPGLDPTRLVDTDD